MGIIRNKNYESYTVYPNRCLEALSGNGDALGLHLYLLSKPDNWRVMAADVEKQMGWGRDKRKRVMRELENAGLIEYVLSPAGTTINVFDTPRDGKATAGKGGAGKPVDIVSTEKEINTEDTNMPKFDEFWREYPNKKGKAVAEAKWKKLGKESRQKAIADVRLRKAKDDDWLKDNGRYIPHGSTYMTQKRWEDDFSAPVQSSGGKSILDIFGG